MNVGCFSLQRNGTGNELSNIMHTFQLQLSVLHQSMCIFKAGLSSLSDDWAKYIKKHLMCQTPIIMLKQHAIPNSS